jgi:hypothetical protein
MTKANSGDDTTGRPGFGPISVNHLDVIVGLRIPSVSISP